MKFQGRMYFLSFLGILGAVLALRSIGHIQDKEIEHRLSQVSLKIYWVEMICLEDDEIGMPVENIIRKHGYPVEIHDIVTEDGYILQTFRIPHGKHKMESTRGRYREPVLINHPFLCSAADYFVLDPEGAIPFMYADAGFDVWVGNFRGNSFSSRHTLLSPKEYRFWNFALDHLALYDIPAQIDHILNVTKREQLVYYGFSKGGGVALLSLALKPEYNNKIRRMTIVAPAGHFSDSKSLLMNNYIPLDFFMKVYDSLLNGQLLTIQMVQPLAPFVCKKLPSLCYLVMRTFRQYHPGQITTKSLTRLSRVFPNWTSLRVYMQAYQWHKTGKVSRFDYGEAENLRYYGTVAPPTYNYSRVTVPTCGLYSLKDHVIEPVDVLETFSGISKWCNKENSLIQDPEWTHIDNMFGKDAGQLVYSRSINFHLQDETHCDC